MVDFLLELAKVTEKKVAREELYKEDERRGLSADFAVLRRSVRENRSSPPRRGTANLARRDSRA